MPTIRLEITFEAARDDLVNEAKKKTKNNLNEATAEDLVNTTQIGVTLAKRLVEHAPYKDWAEVKAVEKIGPRRVRELQACFYIKHA